MSNSLIYTTGDFNKYYRFFENVKREEKTFAFYIDSRDALAIVEGTKYFYPRGGDLDYSRKKNLHNFLVFSLIYGGLIGEFSMFRPHIEEFLGGLDRLNGLSYDHDFLNDLFPKMMERFGNMKEELDTPEYIEFILPDSMNLYLASYLGTEPLWQKRLKAVWGSKISENRHKLDTFKVMNGSMYNDLRYGFNSIRDDSDGYKNANINDSLAAAAVYELKQKKNDIIPVFFDAQNLFRKVINKKNLNGKYEVKIQDTSISTFQGAEFFLMWALYNHTDFEKALITKSEYKDFKYILNHEKLSISNQFDRNDDYIEEFMQTKFFQEFWVKNAQNIEFDEIIKNLINYKSYLVSKRKEINDELLNKINEIQKEIRENSEGYKEIREQLQVLEQAKSKYIDEYFSNYQRILRKIKQPDLFRDLGLLRFSFSDSDSRSTVQFLDNLFSTEDEDRGYQLIPKVLEYSILKHKDSISIDDDIKYLSLLWVLKRHKVINQILSRGKYRSVGHGLLHAAALVEYKRKRASKNLEIIRRLLFREYPNQKTEIKVGLSYAYMLLSYYQDDNQFYGKLDYNLSLEPPNRKDNHSLKEAIILVREALSNGKEGFHNIKLYYYAVNIFIYYNILYESDDKIISDQNIYQKVAELADCKYKDTNSWQYKFDDTISLYYLRLAIANYKSDPPQKNKFSEHLKKAKVYNQEASDVVLDEMDKYLFEKARDYIKSLEYAASDLWSLRK